MQLPRATRLVVRIAGERMYLWRAVDHEGEVLDMLVQRRRDTRAALRLMRKLLITAFGYKLGAGYSCAGTKEEEALSATLAATHDGTAPTARVLAVANAIRVATTASRQINFDTCPNAVPAITRGRGTDCC